MKERITEDESIFPKVNVDQKPKPERKKFGLEKVFAGKVKKAKKKIFVVVYLQMSTTQKSLLCSEKSGEQQK